MNQIRLLIPERQQTLELAHEDGQLRLPDSVQRQCLRLLTSLFLEVVEAHGQEEGGDDE